MKFLCVWLKVHIGIPKLNIVSKWVYLDTLSLPVKLVLTYLTWPALDTC